MKLHEEGNQTSRLLFVQPEARILFPYDTVFGIILSDHFTLWNPREDISDSMSEAELVRACGELWHIDQDNDDCDP